MQIQALEGQQADEIESPVSMAVDRSALRKAGPVENQIAKVLDALSTFSASIEAQRVVNIAALEARGLKAPDLPGTVTFTGFKTITDLRAFQNLVDHFKGVHEWEDPDYDPDGRYNTGWRSKFDRNPEKS